MKNYNRNKGKGLREPARPRPVVVVVVVLVAAVVVVVGVGYHWGRRTQNARSTDICIYIYIYGGCPIFLLPEMGQPPHFRGSFRELSRASFVRSCRDLKPIHAMTWVLCEARGPFQIKVQTHPDSQSGLVPAWMALAHTFRASFAPLSRESMLQQWSQGTKVISPNGIPGLEALNSTSPLVLIR